MSNHFKGRFATFHWEDGRAVAIAQSATGSPSMALVIDDVKDFVRELAKYEKRDLNIVLKIESVLTELMLRSHEPWSSRVQADRIYDIVMGRSEEEVKKPWEHFAVGDPPSGD